MKTVILLALLATGSLISCTAVKAGNEAGFTDVSGNSFHTQANGAGAGKYVTIVVVSHVDVVPQFTLPAIELLRKYRKQSLTESGQRKISILQQTGRPNHFTIIEEWDNESALNKHVGTTQTKDFRTDLQPMLGAPYDERTHTDLDDTGK